ncbi:MAG TPA: hypothetical protein VHM02_11995 [Thermoanaerobaculia bacterium]|nr:hypothetical protein [Thermoanaerobaculia bacterium]
MATCEDYAGTYEVTETNCTTGCTIPSGSTIVVSCSPTTFTLNNQAHSAQIDANGNLEVPDLGVVAAVTGSDPNRVLFGIVDGDQMTGETEVWGAEQG